MKFPLFLAGAAVLCIAAAPQKQTVFGYGGLVGHDGHVDGGPTAIRIDAASDRGTGQVLLAGEEHIEEDGDHRASGPSAFPELHISGDRIVSVQVDGKVARIVALGRYESGAGDNISQDVRIEVKIEDEKGKKQEDHVEVICRATTGEIVFERHGMMRVGGFKLGGGGAK